MKKGFIFLMTMFLLLNSIGFNVYAHYCGDDLRETSLIVETEKSCCEDEEEPMDCCDNKAHLVKIEDDFLKTINIDIEHPCFAILTWFVNYNSISELATISIVNFDISPHLALKSNLNILYSNFRI
ncbi:MAG: HYC_CC_PP family protein [bacterium]